MQDFLQPKKAETTDLSFIYHEVEKLARKLLEEIPESVDAIIVALEFGNTEEFRGRVPVLADELCGKGGSAYPGGKRLHQRRPQKALEPIQKRYHPDLVWYELVLHGWEMVFKEIREKPKTCLYLQMSNPHQFQRRFFRKMQDRVKTKAQQIANYDFVKQPEEGELEYSSENVDPRFIAPNVYSLSSHDMLAFKQMDAKIRRALVGKHIHLETYTDWIIAELKAAEAAELRGITSTEISRRRQALKRFIRARFQKDDF